MGEWYCYFVECADGSLYCGVTQDLARRVRRHNGELVGGARYTKSRRPVKLVAAWAHPTRAAAQRAEARLKKLPADRKRDLVVMWQRNVAGAIAQG